MRQYFFCNSPETPARTVALDSVSNTLAHCYSVPCAVFDRSIVGWLRSSLQYNTRRDPFSICRGNSQELPSVSQALDHRAAAITRIAAYDLWHDAGIEPDDRPRFVCALEIRAAVYALEH